MDHLNNGILFKTICFAGLYTIAGESFSFDQLLRLLLLYGYGLKLIYNLSAVKFTKGCILIGVKKFYRQH